MKKSLMAGRAWSLVRRHYAIRRRVGGQGNGPISELARRRGGGATLRKAVADCAREIRAAARRYVSIHPDTCPYCGGPYRLDAPCQCQAMRLLARRVREAAEEDERRDPKEEL